MGSETKVERTSDDEGWIYYRPASHGVAPGDYYAGMEYEFRLSAGIKWAADPGSPPLWLPSLEYRYRWPDDANLPPLPDGNPKTAAGALKTPLLSVIPAPPLIQVGEVMRLGRNKYGPFNWRAQPVTASTYIDAAMRHLMSWWDGETVDPESGESHLAHAVAGLFVIMDAIATGNATDDRPAMGVAADLIEAKRRQRQ